MRFKVELQDERLPDGRVYENDDQIYLQIEDEYHIQSMTSKEARDLALQLLIAANQLDQRFEERKA
jgi:hypothetical protein